MLSKIFKLINLEKLCALYVVLWIFIPPVQVGTIYRVLAVGCAALWFLFVLFRDTSLFNKIGKFCLIGFLCAALMILYSLFVFPVTTAIIRNLQFIIMLICGAMAAYYMQTDKTFLQILIGACLIGMIIFCCTTTYALINDPYAARIANSEWLEGRFEANKNVGLYGYIYMCVLIAPMLLYKIIKKIKLNPIMDTLFLIAFVLIVIMTTFSGYMIANFCLVAGCGLVIMFKRITPVRCIIFFGSILVFAIFYQDLVEIFFDTLSKIFGENPAYGQKISEFKMLFLDGNASGVTVDERFSNYSDSFELIYQYPIIGSLLCGQRGGGGHSAVFDMIGKYGWLTSVLYFYVFWKFPFEIYKNQSKQTIKLLMLIFIFFSFFNPYSQELSIALFLFFPYVIYIADNHALTKTKNGTSVNEQR